MIKVGIVGDGYTAEELVRLLARHPEAEVIAITSLLNIGRGFDDVFPNLKHYTKVTCESNHFIIRITPKKHIKVVKIATGGPHD